MKYKSTHAEEAYAAFKAMAANLEGRVLLDAGLVELGKIIAIDDKGSNAEAVGAKVKDDCLRNLQEDTPPEKITRSLRHLASRVRNIEASWVENFRSSNSKQPPTYSTSYRVQEELNGFSDALTERLDEIDKKQKGGTAKEDTAAAQAEAGLDTSGIEVEGWPSRAVDAVKEFVSGLFK